MPKTKGRKTKGKETASVAAEGITLLPSKKASLIHILKAGIVWGIWISILVAIRSFFKNASIKEVILLSLMVIPVTALTVLIVGYPYAVLKHRYGKSSGFIAIKVIAMIVGIAVWFIIFGGMIVLTPPEMQAIFTTD